MSFIFALWLNTILPVLLAHAGPNTVLPLSCKDTLTKTDPVRAPQESPDLKNTLQHIVGSIQIEEIKKNDFKATFKTDLDQSERRNAGDGSELITALLPHTISQSTTSLRVERKAVVSKEFIEPLFRVTQSQIFANQFLNGHRLKWTLRDKPSPGHEFLTVTEYGHALDFKNSTYGSAFTVKPRFRKYFEYKTEHRDQLQHYHAAMEDLTVFELKITALEDSANESLLSVRDTVFKPRIFLSDSIADELRSLDTRAKDWPAKLAEIKTKAIELKRFDHEAAVNQRDHVESLFAALEWLLQIDPEFLSSTFVVAYQRHSFRAQSANIDSDYQFTMDKNVRIFRAQSNVNMRDFTQALKSDALYTSDPDDYFVELKAPPKDILEKRPFAQSILDALDNNHLRSHKRGGGKFSIAKLATTEILEEKMDRTLLEHGALYWLIKGTSQLDALPKEKNILAKGDIQVTYPIVTSDNKLFRILFRYKQINKFDGERYGVLDSIRIYDNLGFEVKSDSNFDYFVRTTHYRGQNQILAVEIEGQIVPFLMSIENKDVIEYQQFFSRFLSYKNGITGKPRSLEHLDDIQNNRDLWLEKLRVRGENALLFTWDRFQKVTLATLITLAILHGPFDREQPPPPPPPPVTAAESSQHDTAPPVNAEIIQKKRASSVEMRRPL